MKKNTTSDKKEISHLVARLEEALNKQGNDDTPRKVLSRILLARLPEAPDFEDIASAIDIVAEAGHALQRLEAASLLRCLSGHGALISDAGTSTERSTVTIIERALPELCKVTGVEEKRQTYEKFAILETVHDQAAEVLSPFKTQSADVDMLVGARQTLARALSQKLVKAYCEPFGLNEVKTRFNVINDKLAQLTKNPTNLVAEIKNCKDLIGDQIQFCQDNANFLTRYHYEEYLKTAEAAVEDLFVSVSGRLRAQIEPRLNEGDILHKRYPLHEPGRQIKLSVPLLSTGPGNALNVTLRIAADPVSMRFTNEELHLGTVAPGEFSAVFHGEVMKIADMVSFLLSVEWDDAGGTERKRIEFMATAYAQRSDIDWSSQRYRSPYSTDVAKGDTFVGREDKVRSLGSKILRNPMESFYVTGQKRVGKTSLVHAAVEFAKKHAPDPGIRSKYLLWGEIAHADPATSLRALGIQIADFIIRGLPSEVRVPEIEFDGSIAPLTRLAELSSEMRPGLKHVIVIDEFDEVHPELYQYGNLAETFFANIRALTNYENMCLILIGGENMPFVMDRQGQKLNKYSRVPLDYFSRDEEWDDFRLLVQDPSSGILDWQEDAIAEVFNVTNGNPFFAKIVCAAVFQDCVQERDSDVTAIEVRRAIAAKVPTFDTNAFAHLWQDGIHRPIDQREPDIQLRCRTLVLIARTARRNLPITTDNLLREKRGLTILDTEVAPVINDFISRAVLREKRGELDFVLPIFRSWLIEVGGNRLIADALGEELALRTQAAEDAAFVQSDEIADLVTNWPTYQGREITTDLVRAWFEQVEGHQNQRLLFRLLQNVKFFREKEIRDALEVLHRNIRPFLPEFITRKRSDRREDVLLTYADGQGKSGQSFAARYAEANKLSQKSILDPFSFSDQAREKLEKGVKPAALLFLDDLIATGGSLTRNLSHFFEENEGILRDLDIPVTAMAIAATESGETRVRSEMGKFEWLDFDIRSFCLIGNEHKAFPDTIGIWRDSDEKERAKALCLDLGSHIYPANPLGFGDQGLLICFPENCPNNSIPILHSPSRLGAERLWRPIFARTVK